MARKGRFIIQRSTIKTEEERRAFLQSLSEMKGEVEDLIKTQVEELEVIIQGYNPLDIIANIALRNSIWNSEDYKEYRSGENSADVEYIALLCLSKPFETFHFQNPAPFPLNFIDEIQERVRKLFYNQAWWLAIKSINPANVEPPDRLAQLRFDTLLRSLVVRYMAYHHHLIDILIELFSPLTKEMEDTVGFSIHDAIAILEGIEEISLEKLSNCREEALEFERNLRKAVKNYRHRRKIKKTLEAYPKDLLEELVACRPSEFC